ncbi:uncharacterized protein G2W53_001899 [Senna tora]|uniref:DUF4283 domain-containing protein n=1 Tax=Senna tora TaxID=362788 RepID=A0A835CJV0_9FABA|nr:uncharacterized protein G2W53_001899 [Senna tora]
MGERGDLPPSKEEEDNLDRSKKREEEWMIDEILVQMNSENKRSYRDTVRGVNRKPNSERQEGEDDLDENGAEEDPETKPSDSSSEEEELDAEGNKISGITIDKDDFDRLNFTLSEKEWKRLNKPFRKSLIVKLLGKTIGFKFLLRKVNQLWGRTGEVELIDLGNEYFLAKFDTYSDQDFALTGGPWIILDHYLIVRPWTSLFNPEETIQKLAAWVHLPDLPIELYDTKVLNTIGSYIGKVIKIYTNTSLQVRGKFARLCIEDKLEILVEAEARYGKWMTVTKPRRVRRPRPTDQKQNEAENKIITVSRSHYAALEGNKEEERQDKHEVVVQNLNEPDVNERKWKTKGNNSVFDTRKESVMDRESKQQDPMDIRTPTKEKKTIRKKKEEEVNEQVDAMDLGSPVKQSPIKHHSQEVEDRISVGKHDTTIKDKPPNNARKKATNQETMNSVKSLFKGSRRESQTPSPSSKSS